MKKLVQTLLASIVKLVLKKHRPKIIAITGSVGKTSTRDAIYCVISQKYHARQPKKNFNNEFGLVFAILGVDSPGKNIFLWLWLFTKAIYVYLSKFPEILVLEYGVDHPGDMDYLLSIARPDISVITNIGISHYEFFKSSEAVEKEKGKLAEALSLEGCLIVNADNPKAFRQIQKTKAPHFSYGLSLQSDVVVKVLEEKFAIPATTKLAITAGENFTITLSGIGATHITSAAAAVAVGLYLNLSPEQIQSGLLLYRPVPGRLNFLPGINNSILIDDSYNASPDSTTEALTVLSRAPQANKIAIIGDMLELGEVAQESHKQIGRLVATLPINRLITVGQFGHVIMQEAIKAGFDSKKTQWYATSDEVLQDVIAIVTADSIVLVKGSQGARMEKISLQLLRDASLNYQALPRQYGKWLNQ